MARAASAGGHVIYRSRVPDAISALASLCTSLFAGTKVYVHDGPFTSSAAALDVVVIGWNGFVPGYQRPVQATDEDFAGGTVSLSTKMEGLGPSLRENFTINCAVIARAGNGSIHDARTRAYANLAIIGSNLLRPNAANQGQFLAGAVQRATMSASSQLHETQDRRGALALITFGVECESYAGQ